MVYDSTWTDPDENQTNLESGDILYAETIAQAWMQVEQWLGNDHVHYTALGDGPLWETTPIEDFKTLIFYNPVSWNGPDPEEESTYWSLGEDDDDG